MAAIQDPAGQNARLSITPASTAGIRVLTLRGEIDADTVQGLRDALYIDDTPTSPRSVLDFSDVTFMDSSGVNVLVTAFHRARAAGGWIRMAALTEPVQQVVDIVGLDTIIPCYPTLSEALGA
ncbi:STAS domain-containing protein [Streptomyces sp. NPDC051362]|uniref:STAS domain-containing protein n=1 Tax=Streptomyces sp. NPDC051362 TaxID=3365651 RepID=UPI0037AFCAC8